MQGLKQHVTTLMGTSNLQKNFKEITIINWVNMVLLEMRAVFLRYCYKGSWHCRRQQSDVSTEMKIENKHSISSVALLILSY